MMIQKKTKCLFLFFFFYILIKSKYFFTAFDEHQRLFGKTAHWRVHQQGKRNAWSLSQRTNKKLTLKIKLNIFQFLQPIDDLLERASNRHDVTEANRNAVTSQQSRNSDFLDYDLLMLKHKRAQEKRHLERELAKFTSPQEDFLTAGGRAPVKEPLSYRQLRSRHDDVMNASIKWEIFDFFLNVLTLWI